MNGANGFAIVAADDVYGPRFRRARVEKTSPSNGLREERRSGDDARGAGAAPSRCKMLSQTDTEAREPLWNGPSLNAAFAAQLIGQVLGRDAGRDARSALAAYRDKAEQALALDRIA